MKKYKDVFVNFSQYFATKQMDKIDHPSVDFLEFMPQLIKMRSTKLKIEEAKGKMKRQQVYDISEDNEGEKGQSSVLNELQFEDDNGWALIGLTLQAFGRIYE